MYQLGLQLLKLAATSRAGAIAWTDQCPRLGNFCVDSMAILSENSNERQVVVLKTTLDQLVALGFLDRVGGHYRITKLGRNFAGIAAAPDRN